MEDTVTPVRKSAYANPKEAGRVPYGSIPIGEGDDFEQADRKGSFESFADGVVKRVSWGDSDKPVKRGPGRPRKNIQIEKGAE